MKEIKLSPNISDNDISYRVKQVNKFLDKGEQVKITLAFRGRERIHEDIGLRTINGFVEQCVNGTLASNIKIVDGHRKFITATLNPKGKKK